MSIASIPGMRERTIVINGFSKSYAMTGWRLGYAAGPKEIMKQMLKIHQFVIMCAPTTSQYAAIEALRNGDEDVRRMRESYDERRRFLVNALNEMGLPCFEPKGAFYVFPNISAYGMTSEEFARRLLEQERVGCCAGYRFWRVRRRIPAYFLRVFHRQLEEGTGQDREIYRHSELSVLL